MDALRLHAPTWCAVLQVNDNTLSEPIYLLRASRLSGDSVVYKELMRRLLAKVSHHSNTGVSKPTSDADF